MNDTKNQPNGDRQNQGQPQQGQSGDKGVQPNAPKQGDNKGQQEQKSDNAAPPKDGDKSSSPN